MKKCLLFLRLYLCTESSLYCIYCLNLLLNLLFLFLVCMCVKCDLVAETMSQAGQDVVQMFSSWSPSLTQLITEAQNSLSQLATQVTAEGLYSLVSCIL